MYEQIITLLASLSLALALIVFFLHHYKKINSKLGWKIHVFQHCWHFIYFLIFESNVGQVHINVDVHHVLCPFESKLVLDLDVHKLVWVPISFTWWCTHYMAQYLSNEWPKYYCHHAKSHLCNKNDTHLFLWIRWMIGPNFVKL